MRDPGTTGQGKLLVVIFCAGVMEIRHSEARIDLHVLSALVMEAALIHDLERVSSVTHDTLRICLLIASCSDEHDIAVRPDDEVHRVVRDFLRVQGIRTVCACIHDNGVRGRSKENSSRHGWQINYRRRNMV